MSKDFFIYHQNDPTKVFPIDYSMRKFDPEHGGNTTYVQSMIEHPFIKNILLDLVWSSDMPQEVKHNLGFKKYCLPVEAETFLRSFYKLIATEKYHTTEKKKKKLEDDSLKKDFSADLCLSIAKSAFSSDENERFDDAVYCRRVLSQESGFRRVVMDDLWENELSDRIVQIRELTKKVPSEQQLPVLQNVLQLLDRICLQLIQLQQPDDEEPSNSELPDSEELLKHLLLNRNQVVKTVTEDRKNRSESKGLMSQEKLAIYKVKNSNFAFQTSEGITNSGFGNRFFRFRRDDQSRFAFDETSTACLYQKP